MSSSRWSCSVTQLTGDEGQAPRNPGIVDSYLVISEVAIHVDSWRASSVTRDAYECDGSCDVQSWSGGRQPLVGQADRGGGVAGQRLDDERDGHPRAARAIPAQRSEEHTSELQS